MDDPGLFSNSVRDLIAIGSMGITVVGFGLTIAQLRRTKKAADAAREAIERTTRDDRSDFTRYVFSGVERCLAESKQFVHRKDWKSASLSVAELAGHAAQLISVDPEWQTLATDLREWELSLKQRKPKGGPPFAAEKWDRLVLQLHRKVAQHHGPFKSGDRGQSS